MARKRPRVEPTDDFQEILPLCWWPEQVEYERIRQPVLFGTSITKRAEQTEVSRRTLQRRIARFGEQTSPLIARHIAGVTLAEKFGLQRTRDRYLWDFTLFTSSIPRHPKSAYVSQSL